MKKKILSCTVNFSLIDYFLQKKSMSMKKKFACAIDVLVIDYI